MIDAARWREIEPILDDLLDRDRAERAKYLRNVDSSLRAEIEGLLEARTDARSVLPTPPTGGFRLRNSELLPPPPSLAERYVIAKLLARGGMADVYLANDIRHDRLVALKILSASLTAAVTREHFLSEIRIAARLTHPHIVSLHDSGESEGRLFYVMPFVDGESLRDRLHREGQLSVESTLQIAREVAEALSYAHSHGVVHRDVKPENILFEDGHAVLCDFGIAQAVASAESDSLTASRMVLGTPEYMSPEQRAVKTRVDHHSDIYSLGLVVYEMLTGRLPRDQEADGRLKAEKPLNRVAQPHRRIPSHILKAVHRALQEDPAERFATASDFASALCAVSDPVRRRRGRVVGALSVVTVLLFAAWARDPWLERFRGRLGSDPAAPWSRREVNRTASDAYLTGIFDLSRRTGQATAQARVELERAIQLDSLFAPAYARLAEAYIGLGYFGYDGAPPAESAFARARKSLARALQLDPRLPEAFLAKAQLAWMGQGNPNEAERAILEALRLNPTFADGLYEYGRILTIHGRYSEGVRVIERARELEPLSAERHADLAWVYWLAGRADDAIRAAKKSMQLDSTAPTSYQALGAAYELQHRYADAAVAFEQGLRVSGGNHLFLSHLGHAYAMAGRTTDARRLLHELIALHDQHRAPPYFVAQVYLGLGMRDSALTWLEMNADERSGTMSFLRANPVWKELRDEPRYKVLVRRAGLD